MFGKTEVSGCQGEFVDCKRIIIKKNPEDMGADVKEDCGWIRFNPVDGGVKNENITRFTYALVESDDIPISEQDAIYRKLELPIACLVHSGSMMC